MTSTETRAVCVRSVGNYTGQRVGRIFFPLVFENIARRYFADRLAKVKTNILVVLCGETDFEISVAHENIGKQSGCVGRSARKNCTVRELGALTIIHIARTRLFNTFYQRVTIKYNFIKSFFFLIKESNKESLEAEKWIMRDISG